MDMTIDEARACINAINMHLGSVRTYLLDLYERNGWQALGYASWRECASVEFDLSISRIYQLLNAAQVEKNISTIGGKDMPERQLREMVALEPDEQRLVVEISKAVAPNGKLSTPVIKAVVEVLQEVSVTRALDNGEGGQIEVAKAFEMQVTETAYERLMRQKEHIRENTEKPIPGHKLYSGNARITFIEGRVVTVILPDKIQELQRGMSVEIVIRELRPELRKVMQPDKARRIV